MQKKADSNVKYNHHVSLLFGSFAVFPRAHLKVPLLHIGIRSYSSTSTKRTCTYVYLQYTCSCICYNIIKQQCSRKPASSTPAAVVVRIRHIHVEQLVAVLQQYIHAADNHRSRRRVHSLVQQTAESRSTYVRYEKNALLAAAPHEYIAVIMRQYHIGKRIKNEANSCKDTKTAHPAGTRCENG